MIIGLAARARHCAASALLGVALLPLPPALAANPDLIVTKFTDGLDGSCDADCSLREAVLLANQTPGASRIVLAAGTYRLSILPDEDPDPSSEGFIDDDENLNGDLDIKGTLTIVGRGMDITMIDAGGIDRIAEMLPGAAATFSKLTVRNGYQALGGSGFDVNVGGTLGLQSCGVTGNVSFANISNATGGGIANRGTLSIDASRIDGNLAAAESRHGFGGGIYNLGSLTVRDARFIRNRATDEGETSEGGALYNEGTADIRRATFENNQVSGSGSGAAILNVRTGTLRIENSTLSGNTNAFSDQQTAGAIENGRSLEGATALARLVNVTIAGNPATGLINRGRISITNSIIAGNGLRFMEPESNGDDQRDQNCLNEGAGAQFSQAGLLRGTDTGNCATTLLVLNSDSFVTVLHPLALNNWQSPTFALRKGSVAIDAAVGACPSSDQRRVIRPRDGNGDGIAACDLGSYERTQP
ncbi:CSLREA domain-containing protein [Nevskia ramosa]|uniref:CSLREA domain-containing protein n=1 Tax=Nevskia ramosa TaxID=64002 RepID=UPI0003B36257|nr:CSLREA domain-containing protein [Nevskia ramosa]